MSRESGDQPTQRTVAELLAQYGGKSAAGPRRRHRRPDDEAEPGAAAAPSSDAEPDIATTAPQAIIARIQGEQPEAERQNGRRNGHSRAAERNGAPGPGGPVPSDQPRQPPRAPEPPAAGPGSGYARAPQPPARPPAAAFGGPGAAPQSSPPPPAPPAPTAPPVPPVPPPGPQRETAGSARQEPPAEPQRPLSARLAGLSGGPVPPPAQRRGPRVQESPTESFAAVEAARPSVPPPAPDADEVDDHAYSARDGLAPDDRLRAAEFDDDVEPAFEDDLDEFDADERSVGQQWLAMAGQLALGVVGGAVVWLIFNWLWAEVAVLALIAAVVVIVGLVWIVRKMRRTEDLQTMVLAVLVGLVVTVSPAALLLLSR